MRSPFLKGVLLGSLVAAVVMMTGTAFAGSGIGAVFNLGKTNTVNKTSAVTGSTSRKILQVTNKGAGSALGLTVKAGKAPLTVNSSGKVANLNADTVDGMHASDLTQSGDLFRARRTVAAPTADPVVIATIPGFGVLRMKMGTGVAFMPEFTNTENAGTIFVSFDPGDSAHLAPGESFTVNIVASMHHLFISEATHAADLHIWWEDNPGSVTVFVQGTSR